MSALPDSPPSPEEERALSRIQPMVRPPADDVIDVQYLVRSWLVWLWLPILLGAVGAYWGYRDLQNFRPQAVAAMTVLPSTTSGSTQASTGRVESLAAQFGIQLGAQPSEISPFYRLQMVLKSVLLAERLQERYGLLQRVYGDSWDFEAGEWKRPSGEDFERDQRRRAMLRQNLWAPPNLETLAEYVGGKLQIEPVAGGGFQTVTVRDPDPEFALWLVNTVYFEADGLLREQDRRDSEERRAYITRELAAATNVQVQDALRGMLANEFNKTLTLASNLPYAAKITEPARILNRRTEPNLRTFFGFPIAGMAGVGFFLITLIAVFRRERR